MKTKVTEGQKKLLKQIAKLEKEILKHEDESDRLQGEERFDATNDEKADADGYAREMIGFLEEAGYQGMNNNDFPSVKRLTKAYIKDLSMYGGSSCH